MHFVRRKDARKSHLREKTPPATAFGMRWVGGLASTGAGLGAETQTKRQRRPWRGRCERPRRPQASRLRGRDGVKANNRKEPRMDCASPNRLRQSGRLRARHPAAPQGFYAPRSCAAPRCLVLERAAAAAKAFCPFPLPFFSLFNLTNKQNQPNATRFGELAPA